MKKIFLSLLITMLLVIVVGCDSIFGGSGEGDIIIDTNRTQLYVGNYDGGLGHAWLQEVANEFEKKYENVQVVIQNEKDIFSDSNLLTNMPNYNNDVYFLNGITYSNFVNLGRLADITDVVTTKLDGEENSIEDKMNTTLSNYYKTDQDKYFAVPFFDSIFGAVYDVDLFEEEQLYFNTDGNLIALDDSNTTLSAGPNGVSGDYDDGLPSTYTEWETLVTTMKRFGITPYLWNGTYTYYRQRFLASIWADHEGKENFDLNYSFNGEYTFPGDNNPTDISIENAYLLQQQPGKKYALDYAEFIIRENLYRRDSFDTINTHTMAQQTYLLSAISSPRVGMMLEGTWWENEAKSFFNQMANEYGEEYAFGTRKFGFMPTPKADDGSSAEGTTLISSTGNSVVAISATTSNLEIAKSFVEFVHTDESLRTFTRVTGNVRPYTYSLEASDLESMSHYAKTMFEMYNNESTEISYISLYYHKAFVEQGAFLGTNWLWQSTISNKSYNEPFYEFSQETSLNSLNYFNGLSTTYSKNSWDSKMSGYYK